MSMMALVRILVILNLILLFIFLSLNLIDYQNLNFSAEAQRIFNICETEYRSKCYETNFVELTKNRGLFSAEHTLYALQELDPKMRHCHILSHKIANTATRQNPSKWKELMEKVTVDTCGGGFLHGILEAHVGYEPDFTITPQFINEICVTGKISSKDRSCAHMMGHLTLLQTEGEIEPALKICAEIDEPFLLECYNGVFMEESFKPALIEHGLAQIPVRDEKRMIVQTERCLKYQDLPATACWMDMAEIFAELYNYDPLKTHKACSRAPGQQQQEYCYNKAVTIMTISPRFDNKDLLISVCRPYTDDAVKYRRCLTTMINGLMHYSPNFTNRGVALCSNIEGSYQEFCFKTLGEKLKVNVDSQTKRQELCKGAPDMYMKLCLGSDNKKSN